MQPFWTRTSRTVLEKFASGSQFNQGHVVAMFGAVGEIGGGIDAGKSAEIVDKMRLVEVAAIQRDVRPFHNTAAFHKIQRLLKAADAAKHFGRESGVIAKQLDE